MAGAYPVTVEYPDLEFRKQFYAVPIVGFVLKSIMLIPMYIAIQIIGYIVGLAMLLSWIPVFFTGRYPEVGRTLYGGYIRWQTRTYCFLTGLQDKYPSFSFEDEIGSGDATVTFGINEMPSRFWAFPIVGIVAKGIVLIPHAIALSILTFISCLLMLVTWIPVLSSGRYPEWGAQFIGGTIRWYARVYAYFVGITDRYPPFSLS
jgi:hypothetical protein